MRVAAVGDVHLDADLVGRYRPALEHLGGKADLLLLAGDLTRHGTPDEARCVAREFGGLAVPVIAILGNHDYHSDEQDEVTRILRDAGITVLECSGTVLDCGPVRVGVAGTKGFGGGFAGACASEFGEPEMKAFTRHGRELAERFGVALAGLDCDVRIALTHYSPVPETLLGEPLEIYPFLGSYQLAQAIDAASAAGPAVGLAVHGHAHAGSERGTTPGGVPVRNVAHPVIKQAYNIYQMSSVPASGQPARAAF